jgi:thiosulfate/3-mercaptopyruvate sulfurtransferase
MSALITTDALSLTLGAPGIKIIDASWHMPSEQRDAKREYVHTHIPGAVFFDIDAICDLHSPYPHMLPGEREFAEAIGSLGISNGDAIVVYDSSGIFSAPRVWWMLRVFGHANVRVLDGGLPKWTAEGHATESGSATHPHTLFTAQLKPELLRDIQAIEQNTATKRELVIDARSPGRFSGEQPEPRPGLKSGHIPGSLNVFFKECLTPPNNTLKADAELHELFAQKGVNISQPIVASCGSGVTACILALALYELGNQNVAIYDGAWAEWGSCKA